MEIAVEILAETTNAPARGSANSLFPDELVTEFIQYLKVIMETAQHRSLKGLGEYITKTLYITYERGS